jgi:hypothetical protein
MLVLLAVLASAFASADELSLPSPPDARFALALYCNPTCPDEALDALDAALSEIEPADEFGDRAAAPLRIMGIGGTDFGIPDADFVAAYGVDVDRPEALAQSQMVVLAWFASPRDQAVNTFAIAHRAFADAARSTGGWVEDLDTQTLFGAEAFAARDPRGSIGAWFVIEDAPMGEAGAAAEDAANSEPDPTAELRLITRGLRRYGDFELVVENVPPEMAADVSWVVDAVAGTLHARASIAPSEAVATDVARGTARLEVAEPRDDDPTDMLLRVRFDGELSVPVDEELIAGEESGAASGGGDITPDEITPDKALPAELPASPNPITTLDDARVAVRNDLARRLKPAFDAGLPEGEVIAVNAPWTTRSGGSEYLWVELSSWRGDALVGRLATEPAEVAGLHKGDPVTVRQDEVYDYVWKHADGTREGNLTRPFR